jgi:hypothetical protein
MSIGDAHRGTAKALAHYEREPLWAIGLSALVVATGLARRPAGLYSGRADHTELDAGRGRFAEGPSEFPEMEDSALYLRARWDSDERRSVDLSASASVIQLSPIFGAIGHGTE